MALEITVPDVALIFEGGGMRGAYTSAVVQQLLASDLHLDWVGGISAGSSHTVNYVSRDAERAEKSFTDLATDPNFGSWRTWVRGKGIFNSEYLYEQTAMPDQALPLDWSTFQANPARVRIGGFQCRTGESVYWGKEDMPSVPTLSKRVRASSTLPGLMPIVMIDGEPYCDGALGPSGGIALDAAQADGYEKFFVVLTREPGYRKPPPRLPAAYRAILRRYPKVAEAVLHRHQNYNRVLDQLADLEHRGRAYVYRPRRVTINNQERHLERLRRAHAEGRAQAREELPRWRAFLGV